MSGKNANKMTVMTSIQQSQGATHSLWTSPPENWISPLENIQNVPADLDLQAESIIHSERTVQNENNPFDVPVTQDALTKSFD